MYMQIFYTHVYIHVEIKKKEKVWEKERGRESERRRNRERERDIQRDRETQRQTERKRAEEIQCPWYRETEIKRYTDSSPALTLSSITTLGSKGKLLHART